MKSVEVEHVNLYLQFPQLEAMRHANHTPEEWNRILRQFVSQLAVLTKLTFGSEKTLDPDAAAKSLLASVPVARAYLKTTGHAQQEIDAMPPAQIVLLYVVEKDDENRDNLFRWFYVPYWQAQKGLEACADDLAAIKKREPLGLTSLFLPALSRCAFAAAEMERRQAALRCIEALRLYAAAQDQRLPTTLDEIKEVPIPINPVTGKPFGYHLDGKTAVLDADGGPAGDSRPQYRVSVAK